MINNVVNNKQTTETADDTRKLKTVACYLCPIEQYHNVEKYYDIQIIVAVYL